MREQHYYEIHNAELTHWWFRARRHIVAELIKKFSSTVRPLRLTDVGCGTGASFQMLSQFGWVLGVDSSPLALAFSRERGHSLLVSAALPNLPFPADAFDIVCALDVIEHLEDDDGAVRELLRICKPGGLLVLTVPAYQWLWSVHDDINEHKRRYMRRELQACFTQIPAKLLRTSYINMFLAPPVMIYRQLRRMCRWFVDKTRPAKSDDFAFPAPLNWLLAKLFASESIWLRYGSLPFGTSLICVARKHGG